MHVSLHVWFAAWYSIRFALTQGAASAAAGSVMPTFYSIKSMLAAWYKNFFWGELVTEPAPSAVFCHLCVLVHFNVLVTNGLMWLVKFVLQL